VDVMIFMRLKSGVGGAINTCSRLRNRIIVRSVLSKSLPDVTEDELKASPNDTTCAICRDVLGSAKRLPCGHIFHMHCLREWVQNYVTCPICRAVCLSEDDSRRLKRVRRPTIPLESLSLIRGWFRRSAPQAPPTNPIDTVSGEVAVVPADQNPLTVSDMVEEGNPFNPQ